MTNNDEMMKKSLQTLELQSVLDRCAFFAVSEEAKKRIRGLLPQTEAELAEDMLLETNEARNLLRKNGSPGFGGLKDISLSILRVRRGGTLNLKELLEIAQLLKTVRTLKGYLNEENETSLLAPMFSSLLANKYLEERIFSSVMSEEELSDLASPELADIRRHRRSINDRIRSVLQKMISSPGTQKMLQENLITIRQGRFVIPVKAEYRSAVSGLVHDVSASGATYFIEPMQVVQLNNDLKELQSREEAEVDRIIAELSSLCGDFADTLEADYEQLVTLDILFAKGKYADDLDGVLPAVNEKGILFLKNARHPLLEKKTAVPITVDLGRSFDTLVITGPNTGGKTVTLKTMGLLVLMAQCGLLIPAEEGSEIPMYQNVYADIGDEQSITQSLSTFSAHMKNIIEILQVADDRSFLLFDELGAGTDPVEGAALAVSIIQYARSLGARVAATTHYAELKEFAMTTSGVENASCEFDVDSLRPTYRLLIGIPGRSNAFAISSRLGLPDYIVQSAQELIGTQNRKFEDMLLQIDQKRKDTEEARLEAMRERNLARSEKEIAQKNRIQLEKERESILEEARAEGQRMLDEIRREVDQVQEELRKEKKAKDYHGEIHADINHRLNVAQKQLGIQQEPVISAPPENLKKGETVELLTLKGAKGTVLSEEDKDGKIRVQAGIMQLTVPVSEVRRIQEKHSEKNAAARFLKKSPDEMRMLSAKTEIDLRGMTVEEGLLEMNQFLDGAILAGLPSVSIIHGKGTGVLRNAVHQELKRNRQVKGFRLGKYGEGENGVTIVEFR